MNIETPRGLDNVVDIASASRRIVGLQLGFGDLFSPLGIERSPISQGPVRLKVRLAAGGARVPAYDGAFVVVSNPEGFRAEAEAARAMGFAGKTCIHPSQTPIANDVFFPRQDEIEAARRVVEKADEMEAKGRWRLHRERRHVRRPLITRARDTVRLAEERSK